ncbi:thiamine-phosphate kinase [Actinomadura logoneensis]|uniref:Thiamine-monophosphate kinase n=1 Tax=Actinomadura logoneensis TaxID=2293572 RepID=A0A372JIK2_9ACTN|nr:thiamine-phosphate kinase [Actinomadura logoneensis]RFU39800.1 thiamine-phosphate kinase [Actinomadura logoneensis]
MESIGDLGEFGLIRRVTGRPMAADVLLGPGDDAAVVAAPDGRVVATTDVLVEGRHFRLDWSSPYDIGRKAAAQNLADVVAMGARPTALLVGFGAPAETPAAWAQRLTDGIVEESALVGASVAGGDTVGSPTITIAVTALGDLGGAPPLTRSGARPGDVVAVRGRLGWAASGLHLLQHGLDGPAELVAAHRRPQPPYSAGQEARSLGATAMLDVSDGLLQDLGHIAERSGVAIDVTAAAVPLPPPLAASAAGRAAASRGEPPTMHQEGKTSPETAADDARTPDRLHLALTGGEDHAFAATFPAGTGLPPAWTVVGRVAEGSGVTVDGSVPAVRGWDHFRG